MLHKNMWHDVPKATASTTVCNVTGSRSRAGAGEREGAAHAQRPRIWRRRPNQKPKNFLRASISSATADLRSSLPSSLAACTSPVPQTSFKPSRPQFLFAFKQFPKESNGQEVRKADYTSCRV